MMRARIVTVVLAGLFLAFAFFLVTRTRTPHLGPPILPTSAPASSATSSASASSSAPIAAPSASAPVAIVSASAAPSSSAPPSEAAPLDRPLRVVALGWELAAATIVENDGLAPNASSAFAASKLDVSIKATASRDRIEAALARGGADDDGADVAILPLPLFVGSYERIRALEPEVFFVTGFSHGREAILAAKDAPFEDTNKDVKIVGTAGDTASFFALSILWTAGVSADHVRFVGADAGADAPYAAVDRDLASSDAAHQRILLTTADTPKLVPFVAIASRSFVEGKTEALVAWARGEMDGAKKIAADPSSAARAITKSPGAPDPLALLKALGETESAAAIDERDFLSPSSMRLSAALMLADSLFRGAGAIATQATPGVDGRVAAAFLASASIEEPKPVAVAKPTDTAKPILVRRDERFDETVADSEIAVMGATFPAAAIRVAVAKNGAVDPAATKKLLARATEDAPFVAGRLFAANKPLAKNGASFEVFLTR